MSYVGNCLIFEGKATCYRFLAFGINLMEYVNFKVDSLNEGCLLSS